MRPVILIVLDGWGVAPPGPGNALSLAHIPFYNKLLGTFPNGLLEASGEAVGLPKGEDGNTETGHMNLGAGYIVNQDLPRINLSIADGSFFQNHAFISAVDHARKYNSNLHLMGLIGSGGVHSNIEHLLALIHLCKEQSFKKVYLHLFTDGRDSPPKSSIIYINQIQAFLNNLGFGKIASLIGRYYAMDRDLRWDRTQKAYEALTKGIGIRGVDPVKLVEDSYRDGITDEFIMPSIITKDNEPVGLISDFDSVIFFNYRIDRPRQLTKAFVMDDFEKEAHKTDFDPYSVKYHKKHVIQVTCDVPIFNRGNKLNHLYFTTMTEYMKDVHVSAIAFPPHIVLHPIGECISDCGLRQLRLSESEKERFVTYYFNGQRENPFIHEDRIIVPSPKVPTYDLVPEMSSFELTDVLLHELKTKKYDFILINYASPDMVAHTGVIPATVKACESIDKCLGKIIPDALKIDGTVFITGDHGNAEELIDPQTGRVDTEHSTYPVPFIAVNNEWEGKPVNLTAGILSDIAPTILDLMHIKKPKEMTSRNLLKDIIDF